MSTLNRALRTAVSLLLAVMVSLAFAACDSGGDNDTDPSFQNEFSFDITDVSPANAAPTGVTGKAQVTLEGFSFFFEGTDPETDEQIFVLYFTQDNDLSEESASQGLFGFAVRQSLRPGEGVYNFVSFDSESELQSDFGMMLFESVGNVGGEGESFRWYLSDAGTIEMTTSSDDRVGAIVNAEALRVSFDGSVSDTTRVTIDGTVAARSADSFVGFSPFTP